MSHHFGLIVGIYCDRMWVIGVVLFYFLGNLCGHDGGGGGCVASNGEC